MKLEHDFTVPAPVDEAWKVLLDVERVTPCMPGATLLTVDGDEFTGSVKVKVGPITVTYNGKAKFVERDESTHRAVIEASGRETRGSGTASATVNAVLAEAGAGTTRVTVETDLNVTGRPAQFGRGVMEEVGAKLVGQFADRLAAELASPAAASTAAAEADPAAEPDPTGNSAKKTAAAKKTTGKKTTAKKTTAKTTAEASSATTKTTAKKATAKKSTAKKAVAEKSVEPVAEKSAEPVAAATSAAPPTTQPPASQQTAPAGTSTGPRIVPPPARPAEPIDLLDVAGGSMAKRLAPLVGVLVVVLLLLRRRRRR